MKEQLVDLIVMEQLVITLNQRPKTWVNKHRHTFLEEVVRLIEFYGNAEEGNNVGHSHFIERNSAQDKMVMSTTPQRPMVELRMKNKGKKVVEPTNLRGPQPPVTID